MASTTKRRRAAGASKQSDAAAQAASESLEDDLVKWASVHVKGVAFGPEGTPSIDVDRALFCAFHLDQVPEAVSDEDGDEGVARRPPSSAELEAAAYAMALSGVLREAATMLKHGLGGPGGAADAVNRVHACARLFDFPIGATPNSRRSMIMTLVAYQCDGFSIRDMKGAERVPVLSSVALGVLSGICVRMPDLAASAQRPEALRAIAAVVRAHAGVRDGGPGIDTALQRLFEVLGMPPTSKNTIRQARMDWKRELREGKPRRRKKS